MKLTKLPSGSYRATKMYKGKRYSETFKYKPTQKEVLQALAEKMDGIEDDKAAHTFKEYAETYFQIKENVLSPSTIRGYDRILNLMSDSFKNTILSDITNIDIQKEINDYAKDHAPKTVRNMSGFISSVMGEFRPKYEYSITLPQRIEEYDYMPTDEEIKAILKLAKGTMYEIGFLLAISGLRRSEICALTKADLSEDGILTINKAYVQDKDNEWHIKNYTKNETSTRQIKLIPQLIELINEVPDGEKLYKGYPASIYRALQRYCNTLGIPRFRFHTCRAYYVSLAHSIGIPDQYIMTNTGHKTDYVLKSIYRRAKSDTQKEMDEKMLDKMKSFL